MRELDGDRHIRMAPHRFKNVANASSVSSDQRPRSSGLIRPSGNTAVASMIRRPAPERARLPRWIVCQSVARPSSAEYWHIGAITMRLRSSSEPTL